jgi:hypothetical protein
MDNPRKNATNARGRPFEPGNPGKPKGARNRASLAAAALLDGEAEALTRKAVEMALAGDTTALRLCLERILPPRKERAAAVELPLLLTAADVVPATSKLIEAVSAGQLTPTEASEIGKLIESFAKSLLVHEIEGRLATLEASKPA